MKVALCGYPPFALQVQESLKNIGIESKFFIRDFVSIIRGGNAFAKFPPINAFDFISFFDFRRLVNEGELDGVIIAYPPFNNDFIKSVVKTFKFHSIPRVGILDDGMVYWLNASKVFIPYFESDITDKCNLKCAGCYHFANFSLTESFYPLENFHRDIRHVSRYCDVIKYRLLGGEPLLLQNLDEYIKIAREFLPKTNLRILTNGLLIPSLPQRVLNAIHENNFSVDISGYPPTLKMIDKIQSTLEENKIPYTFERARIETFNVFLTMNGDNNPLKSRLVCCNEPCRSMHNGKIYKCPLDAFYFKMINRFRIKKFPQSTGVDIYAENFPSLVQMLDGNVEMCHWCGETCREIPWQPTNNPQLEDWLAYPEELKNA